MKGKGGPWTERKLAAVRKYLPAFNEALKDKPSPSRRFRRIYIDAFAGSGGRELDELPLLLPGEVGEIATIAKGSARIALESEPAFDEFLFIERSAKNADDLDTLRAAFLQRNVVIRVGDANAELVKLAKRWNRKQWRGVLFIDPHGCQLEWHSLTAIAETRSIDVWLLFPVNAIRRMLPRDAMFQKGWRERLDRLFGTTDWFDRFYELNCGDDMFDVSHPRLRRTVDLGRIEEFYRERLLSVFRGGVCRRPLALGPERRERLFSLFFACSNPSEKASTVAFRIANHILGST